MTYTGFSLTDIRFHRENDLTTPMKKTALITGAEGFIGSHLVKFLHDKGWNVVGTYLRDGAATLRVCRILISNSVI